DSIMASVAERCDSSERRGVAARPPNRVAAAAPAMSVRIVKGAQALTEHVPAWDALASAALEPNVFFESWALLPAIDKLPFGSDVLIALVYGADPASPERPARLCGLFPLERRRWRGLPIQSLGLWCHRHAFVGLPLLHR